MKTLRFKHNLDSALREQFKRSYYKFFVYFWDTIINDDFKDNFHIKYLCDELQAIVEKVIRKEAKEYDLIINIPPGSSKSTIATVMLNAWAWTVDPSLRFITGSYSKDLAMDHSTLTRDVLRSDKYKRLYPNIKPKADRDNKSDFANTDKGTRTAVGVGGAITGKHGHLIIIDDPINPKMANSEVERKTANRWMSETLSTRKIDKAITPTILIMQRLHEDDPTGNQLSKDKKIKLICLPAELGNNVQPIELKDKYINNLLDPERMPQNVLNDLKIELGTKGYAGQMLQNPSPEDGDIYKLRWFKEYDEIPNYEYCEQFADTAQKTKEHNDFSVIETWGKLGNSIYLLDVDRGKWESPELIKRIELNYDKWKPRKVWVEDKVSGTSSIQEVRRRTSIPIFPIQRNTDKVLRANLASPKIEAGYVYLPRKAPYISEFLLEVIQFPNAKHDDQVDPMNDAIDKMLQTGLNEINNISMGFY